MLSKILGILPLQQLCLSTPPPGPIFSRSRAGDDPGVFITRRASHLVVSVAFCSGKPR